MRYVSILPLIFVIYCCKSDNDENLALKKSHPSHSYKFVIPDSSKLGYFETDYLPVYSDIYHKDGTRRFYLTTTLSIRNTSLIDSAYIISATYYDSYGRILKEYVDSVILLSPLESIEFVVEEKETIGGAGANFIVSWGAPSYSDQLLIQAIMIGTYGQQGISFVTDAKIIENH